MSLEPSQRNQDSDRAESTADYRLRYHFGDLRLYSEWESELAVVENLAEQLRRGDGFHDVTIEQRTEFRFFSDCTTDTERNQ
jgi:hypothetical protein